MSKKELLDEIYTGFYVRTENLKKISNIKEMSKSLEYLYCITDADTTIADIIKDVNMEESGTFEELCTIYENTTDTKSFEALFRLFTDHSFEEYLKESEESIKDNFRGKMEVDKGNEILSEDEFNGLDKITTANKLDWYAITQFNGKDYITDLENGQIVSFEDGLQWIYESISEEQPDYKNDYNMTKAERDAVVNLFKKYNISEDL